MNVENSMVWPLLQGLFCHSANACESRDIRGCSLIITRGLLISGGGVVESTPPPIGGGVIKYGPIFIRLISDPSLAIINERPLMGLELFGLTIILGDIDINQGSI